MFGYEILTSPLVLIKTVINNIKFSWTHFITINTKIRYISQPIRSLTIDINETADYLLWLSLDEQDPFIWILQLVVECLDEHITGSTEVADRASSLPNDTAHVSTGEEYAKLCLGTVVVVLPQTLCRKDVQISGGNWEVANLN